VTQLRMGLVLYSHHNEQEKSVELEWILIGILEQKIKFIKREIILSAFSRSDSPSLIFQKMREALQAYYKSKHICTGRLRIAVSASAIKSAVLGNLCVSPQCKTEKNSEFLLVLAHLKQHWGEGLNELSVDFKRISDQQVLIVSCPRELIYQAELLSLKRIPVDIVEPSMHALLRLLQQTKVAKNIGNIEDFPAATFAFFWMDEMFGMKKYRLSVCQGFQIIWDHVLANFDFRSELVNVAQSHAFNVAFEAYAADPMAFSKWGPPSCIYLWIEPAWEAMLTQVLNDFLKAKNWSTSRMTSCLPVDFGLQAADEFVPLGLAIR